MKTSAVVIMGSLLLFSIPTIIPNTATPPFVPEFINYPAEKQGEYLTHREADEAVKLIRQWKDQPFFIQVSHYAVHTPIQAIQEVADKYKFKEGMSETNRKYAAMVESIDDCMRDMLAELKKHGLDKNTMIIFTSDNGGLDRNGSPTENAPLRSGKGYCYEGGIRPFSCSLAGQDTCWKKGRFSGLIDRSVSHNYGSNRYGSSQGSTD